MKLTKIFGIVLFLHVGVILIVMFPTGCQSLPWKKNKGEEAPGNAGTPPSEEVNPAFNAGIDSPPVITPDGSGQAAEGSAPTGRFEPTRPLGGEVPSVSPGSSLRPEGLRVYRVQRGDTLWGIARRNGLTLTSLLGVNNLDKEARLQIGQEVFLPGTATPPPLITPDAPVPVSDGTTDHVVKSGETLTGIASSYGVTVAALKATNELTSDLIRPGQSLNIPGGGSTPSIAPVVIPAPTSGQATHVVQAGETLSGIARMHGTTTTRLQEINGIVDPGKLSIGQVLDLEPSSEASPVTPEVVPSEPDPDAPLRDILFRGREVPVVPAEEAPVPEPEE